MSVVKIHLPLQEYLHQDHLQALWHQHHHQHHSTSVQVCLRKSHNSNESQGTNPETIKSGNIRHSSLFLKSSNKVNWTSMCFNLVGKNKHQQYANVSLKHTTMPQTYLTIPMPETLKILKSLKIFLLPTIGVDTLLIFKAVTRTITLTSWSKKHDCI